MYSLAGMRTNDGKIIFLVLMSLPEGLRSVGGRAHQDPHVLAAGALRSRAAGRQSSQQQSWWGEGQLPRSSWVLVSSQLSRTREVPHKDSWAAGLGGGISLLAGFPAPTGLHPEPWCDSIAEPALGRGLEQRPPEVPNELVCLMMIQWSQFKEDTRILERIPGRPY